MAYLKVVNENGTKRLIDYSKAPQYNKLAVNEPTTTASQSYTKGEYLTQGGYFKKVTSAIASGDTISSSNTEDTTVGEELTQINSDLSNKQNISSALKVEAVPFVAGNINANDNLIINVNGITNNGNDVAYIVDTTLDYIIGTARRENDTTARVTLHNFYSQAQNVNYAVVIRLYK